MHPGAEHKCGSKVTGGELRGCSRDSAGSPISATFGWLKDAKAEKDRLWYGPSGGAGACWNSEGWLLDSNKTAASIRVSSWLIEWPQRTPVNKGRGPSTHVHTHVHKHTHAVISSGFEARPIFFSLKDPVWWLTRCHQGQRHFLQLWFFFFFLNTPAHPANIRQPHRHTQ